MIRQLNYVEIVVIHLTAPPDKYVVEVCVPVVVQPFLVPPEPDRYAKMVYALTAPPVATAPLERCAIKALNCVENV